MAKAHNTMQHSGLLLQGLYGLVQWHVYWVLQLCLSSVLGLGQAGQNCKAVDSVPSLGQGHIPHFWSFA